MENAFISGANFRLAHLLLEKTITGLVVTTNFDDFLSRALTLFGRRPVVCDHPSTLARIDIESKDVRIIHVHGSYWFYDCLNLKEEISEGAKCSKSSSSTMPSMLDSILRAHSPLVVGYSGWEGDVFMTALKRRLSAPLRTNLYWFCYKRRDADALPEWLRECPNVCAVVPENVPGFTAGIESDPSVVAGAQKGSGKLLTAGGKETAAYAISATEQDEPAMQATSVFGELIRRFGLAPPPLTKDPIGFFANHLKDSLLPPLGDKLDEAEDDVYTIRAVIGRLDRARQRERDSPSLSLAESALESFRNAIRQSDHRLAIRRAGDIPLQDLTVEQLRELVSALADAALAFNDNSGYKSSGLDLILAAGTRLEHIGQDDSATRSQVARALVDKGIMLDAANRDGDAVNLYDEVLRRFGEPTEPAQRRQVARALGNKGVALCKLNRVEDAISLFDEVVRRFGEAADPTLHLQIARSLFNKGVALRNLNRGEDEVRTYDEVVRRFGDATEPALREVVASALASKGVALGTLSRPEDAIGAYDEVVRRFGDAIEPALRGLVAKALAWKAIALSTLNRTEDEVSAYDEVVRRFGEAIEPALREVVAGVLFNKGVTLNTLNRREDAINAYDEVARQFGDATEPALRGQVARALVNKGFTLNTLNRREDAISAYDEVVRRFGDASEPALREAVAKADAERKELRKSG
jgi:tetratricopeptide (TPR) repeat protein